MSPHDPTVDEAAAAATAVRRLREAEGVTVLTGAGISTDSGLPDFRGPQGRWTRDPGAQRLSSIDAYVTDPEVRRAVWRERVAAADAGTEPNDAHRALVRLERAGRLRTVVTQNVDRLHHAAGSSPDVVVEIHGNVAEVVCLDCGARGPAAPVHDRVRAGQDDPRCPDCDGLLKSATVSFGQRLDPADLQRAQQAARECDLLLAVGTSLMVHPVAALPALARDAGAALIIVNAEPTPYDDQAAAVLREPIGRALPKLVDRAIAA